MRRFYNDDSDKEDPKFFEDGFDEDFNEEDIEELEGATIIDGEDIANVMSYELAQEGFKHHLLDKAIDIAKSSWFWVFKSPQRKLREVHLCYEWLKAITEVEPDEREE